MHERALCNFIIQSRVFCVELLTIFTVDVHHCMTQNGNTTSYSIRKYVFHTCTCTCIINYNRELNLLIIIII